MIPIRKGTASRLGLGKPLTLVHSKPYALIPLAFPAPKGATAWVCLVRRCGARRVWLSSSEEAEASAIRHVAGGHPLHRR